jgi:DNA polymerase zeta
MSRGHGGDWVAEARWWDELRKRIERERNPEPTVVGRAESWEKWVMTTFESVEALWEPEWRTWKPDRDETISHTPGSGTEDIENPFAQATQDASSIIQKGPQQSTDVDVDEALLSSQEMSQIMDHGDQEWENLQEGDTVAEPDDTAIDVQLVEEEPPPDLQIDVHNPSGEVEVTTNYERFSDLFFPDPC